MAVFGESCGKRIDRGHGDVACSRIMASSVETRDLRARLCGRQQADNGLRPRAESTIDFTDAGPTTSAFALVFWAHARR